MHETSCMYAIVRFFLFFLPAETAHHFTLNLLKLGFFIPGMKWLISKLYQVDDTALQTTAYGLSFPNKIGLAAGFDKNAKYIDELSAFGFGFIEIGTVTPLPQIGNPLPRLFRLKKDKAIINRMGFNNDGVDAVLERLKKRKSKIIVGGNIGKNKITPNEKAVDDYLICFEKLFDYVDYFVVNVSSPNTPNLRELQEKDKLAALLHTLQQKNMTYSTTKPILLKIAPDLNEDQLKDIAAIVKETGIAGVISSNTTIARSPLSTSPKQVQAIGNGGLSGAPLLEASNNVLHQLVQLTNGEVPIIAVGGIMSAKDAQSKLDLGATLVQVYSGFIYEGPGLIKSINKGLQTKS